MRITYVGELGWELHLPVENAVKVYNCLHAAGESYGLRDAGYRAIETLRLEKAYRAWGSDIGPDHTPVEAGLDWAVKMNSSIDFKGLSAIQAQYDNGIKKILATFTCDGNTILSGRETVFRNGERCGWLSSAGFGHTIQKSIGMGYIRSTHAIDNDFVLAGDYELEVATQRVKCCVTMKSLVDPMMEKVKS